MSEVTMKDKDEKIETALNNILQFLTDSKSCFEKHVHNVNDPNLKILFKKYASERGRMIEDLKNELSFYTQNIVAKGTILGKSHMVFENIKSFVMNGDALSITKEVRRGEGVLIEYYKNALNLDLRSQTRSILLNHLKQIQEEVAEADLESIS